MHKIKERWVQSLGQENPQEEGMAIHSLLAWRIPWTEEPGRLWSTGSQRVGHNWSDLAHTHTHTMKHKHSGMFFLWCITCLVLCFCGCYSFCLPGLNLWNNCQFSGFNPQSPILFVIFFLENLPNYGFNSHLCLDKLKPYYPQHISVSWVLDSYL